MDYDASIYRHDRAIKLKLILESYGIYGVTDLLLTSPKHVAFCFRTLSRKEMRSHF